MPTPEMIEFSRKVSRKQKRDKIISWLKTNALAIIAIIISLYALHISKLSLRLQERALAVSAPGSPQTETSQPKTDDPQPEPNLG